jgi:hypothetical protein
MVSKNRPFVRIHLRNSHSRRTRHFGANRPSGRLSDQWTGTKAYAGHSSMQNFETKFTSNMSCNSGRLGAIV